MNDLTLSYFGGSGGFLLLHLLLLSGKFNTEFTKFTNNKHQTLKDIINFQWNMTENTEWKKSEVWPDNKITNTTESDLCKLYFVCSPSEDTYIYPSKKLLLYTDIDSHFELAFYKKAYWFYGSKTKSLDVAKFKLVLLHWKSHYKNLKGSDWPKCISFRKIHRLPEKVQQELLENQHTQLILNYQSQWPGRKNFEGTLVAEEILPFLNSADYVIKLQDLINTEGRILENLLDLPEINEQQIDLIKHWKSLHPPEFLTKIGIRT